MKSENSIKKYLNEALGVPDNLHETSVEIYERFLNWTKKLKESDLVPGVGKTVNFRGNFRISDYEFTSVQIKLGVEPHPQVESPDLVSMTVSSESRKTDNFLLKTIKSKTIKVLIIVVVPESFDYSELYDFFKDNRNEIIQSLSHEFKHAYDHHKKVFDRPTERAFYQGVIGLTTGVDPIDHFIHDLYYTSVSENLVRPTEIVSAIKNNQISQKEFVDFLKSQETFQNFKRISQFNLDDFKKNILNHKGQVGKFLRKLKFKPSTMTDEEKLQAIMKATYFLILNSTFEEYRKILVQSVIEDLLGFSGDKQKNFEKFVSKMSRFRNNPEDFFRFYEKQFHQVGNEMLRKIYKLYALLER